MTRNDRHVIQTKRAPAAIGTYSQAIRVGDTVYVSGQIPLDPASGELVSGEIRAQIRQVFANLQAVAEAADTDLARAVKVTIYLTDLGTFPLVNEIMAEFFPEPFPARAAIGVASLPRGAGVEADAVLVV
jgi:reactive intermediate/imine deaminase